MRLEVDEFSIVDADADADADDVDENQTESNRTQHELKQRSNVTNANETDQRYSCDECDKSFIHSRSLIRHKRRVHSDEKPFECDECDMSFCHSSDLNKHKMTVHQMIRLFSCVQCDKRFSNAAILRKHSRVHTGLCVFIRSDCSIFLNNHLISTQ